MAEDPFNETLWTLISEARDPKSPTFEKAFGQLCDMYYPGVLLVFEAQLGRFGGSKIEAKELAQSFFTKLVEDANGGTGILAGVKRPPQPKPCKFRKYLQTCLKNFRIDEHRKANAQKRVDGKIVVSMDDAGPEFLDPSFENFFERQCASRTLDAAKNTLLKEYEAAGQGALCKALLDYLDSDDATLEAIAEELGMSPAAVRKANPRFRSRFREALRAVIEPTVSSKAALGEETRDLLHALARK